MSKSRPFFTLVFLFAAAATLFFGTAGCNKCTKVESSYSGEIISMYDFKSCYIYANFDSTLILASDTAFANFKASRFKNCNASLDAVDFSKNVIIGFKTVTNACNAAFHRSIQIDTVNKLYNYTVEVEKCKGCGTELTSYNIALGPKIPQGYTVKFIRKER